ncbi:gliding motility-associated C-terminal domain-containing protein [Lishizhenia tianjinensis]|uniref:Gliding motility-associated C-terminal domain-containing protein n=1 Tax=Lishizhenia tianjinensis TaxID=477690 RepID=A0A1I6ZYW0_9FLAO|nr:gliding motility-associated C-terminal domain-containing protein [Lishizhenia tianjinensis]SFT67839.1 gliding motility-associated C-terminal domain-containing protein [Lishizhenia tianjinensis]
MKNIYLICIFLSCTWTCAQQLIHQDIFHGGVTAGAVSKGMFENFYTDTLELFVEPGSSIRNANLYYYRRGFCNDKVIKVNGNSIVLDSTSHSPVSKVKISVQGVDTIFVYKIDLTRYLTSQELLTGEFYIYNPPSDIPQGPGFRANWGYFMPMIYIEYEKSTLPIISTSLFANSKEETSNDFYSFSGFNSRVSNSPFALSLFLDRVCGGSLNGSQFKINGVNCGILDSEDSVSYNYFCAGAHGTYYFQNNQIQGLYDDTPDAFLGGSDALIDLNTLVSPYNDYNLEEKHVTHPNTNPNKVNHKLLFSHAFSTPCDTFSTAITADTSICLGDSLLLTAIGGSQYKWINHQSLSDSLGASVWAKPQKISYYTVQIENVPGCSRTENVSVKIHPSPKLKEVIIDTASCGESNGSLTVYTTQNVAFEFNIGNGYQNSRFFNGLAAGEYVVQARDYFGCVQEMLVDVPFKIDVLANFESSILDGAKPLNVNLTNTSENATNYQWYINGDFESYNVDENITITQSGDHYIDLIAYNQDTICSDTATLVIRVYDSLILNIPNVFTPNNDGKNDFFSIQQTGVHSLNYEVYNRWGNTMKLGEVDEPLQEIELWDGTDQDSQKMVTSGTYFYRITAKNKQGEEKKFEGFVQVIR